VIELITRKLVGACLTYGPHHEIFEGELDKTTEIERAADDLAEQSGFKRAYSVGTLKSMAATEKRVKRYLRKPGRGRQ
jgi:hypothetical protein